jgi:MFS family permease
VPVLIKAFFFPAPGSTAGTVASFATFAVAFIARPVGSVNFGHHGDWIGRKRTLIVTLLLMGISTVLIGLLPGAATIGVAAPILLSATFLVTSLTLGNIDQSFLDYGWRVPFLISIMLVAAGLYVRVTIGVVTGAVTALSTILSAISSDRFGRRTLIMASCGGAAVWSLLLFPLLDTHSPVAFAIGMIVTVGLQGLAYGPAGAFLPETFPTRYRYTGAGMSYNLAGIVVGVIPPRVAAPLAAAYGNFTSGILLCALSRLSLFGTKALVETKGRDPRQAHPSTAAIR